MAKMKIPNDGDYWQIYKAQNIFPERSQKFP